MEHHLTTYITHDTLISALGFSTQENLEAIRAYHSGITLQTDKRIADTPLLAATISQERLKRSFFGKWQKTLPVISMLRNGYMSSPTPAYQECQPL